MTNLPARLRAVIVLFLVAAVVACTPGSGASPAPAASTGTVQSTAPASEAPASGLPAY